MVIKLHDNTRTSTHWQGGYEMTLADECDVKMVGEYSTLSDFERERESVCVRS